MSDTSHITTPMAIKVSTSSNENKSIDTKEYRWIMGLLQYLTFSLLDIAYVVNKACQHCQSLTMQHLKEVKIYIVLLKRDS